MMLQYLWLDLFYKNINFSYKKILISNGEKCLDTTNFALSNVTSFSLKEASFFPVVVENGRITDVQLWDKTLSGMRLWKGNMHYWEPVILGTIQQWFYIFFWDNTSVMFDIVIQTKKISSPWFSMNKTLKC